MEKARRLGGLSLVFGWRSLADHQPRHRAAASECARHHRVKTAIEEARFVMWPSIRAEPLHRPEAGLVGHPLGPFDPIAEIDVRKACARCADDMIENDVSAE